jgi:DNA sulfur modification protein DndD
MREEISNKTEEHFANLMPAKERNKIAINENYEITVLEREKNRTYALSKGQQTMLAVSFITALNSVSGFNAPIVMDSVLGRIDVEVRNNFARKISTYLKDTQIILLALDSEYTGAVKEEFKDHIFSEHSIVKESNTISKIKIRN